MKAVATDPDVTVVGEAADGPQTLEALDRHAPDLLEALDRHAPDLLVLDISMPGIDGLAVAEQMPLPP